MYEKSSVKNFTASYRKITYCNKLLAVLRPYKTDMDVCLFFIQYSQDRLILDFTYPQHVILLLTLCLLTDFWSGDHRPNKDKK